MKKIAFINVYFGKFPAWFPAFLKSCEYQEGIDFFFFTNCETPEWFPLNVKFISFDERHLKALSLKKTGLSLNLQNYYKLCDLKSMYGHWFSDYITEYDYWGHCDIDVIWGDLRKYLSIILDQDFDVISGG